MNELWLTFLISITNFGLLVIMAICLVLGPLLIVFSTEEYHRNGMYTVKNEVTIVSGCVLLMISGAILSNLLRSMT